MPDNNPANRMRDLGLAQRQFYGGLMLLLSAGILANLWTLPQYHKFQSNATETHHVALNAALVKTLPSLAKADNAHWTNQIMSKLQDIAAQNHVTLASSQNNIDSVDFKKQTFAIKKVTTTLQINGAYPAIQAFISELLIAYPYTRIQSLAIHPAAPHNTTSTEPANPGLEGILALDVSVLTP